MLTISAVMTRDPALCTPDDLAVDCAKLMAREDVGFVPVVESRDTRRLLGVVTDRDLCLAIVAEGRDPNGVRVEEVMTERAITVAPADSLDDALALMQEHRIRRLCVADEFGACIGVVAQADVARAAPAPDVKRTLEEISRPDT